MTEDETPLAVSAKGVGRTFAQGGRAILDGLDLFVSVGEMVAIVGKSGAGKTTLLNALGALDPPSRGEISIFGERVNALDDSGRGRLRNRLIGFVFQAYYLLEHLSVVENVKVPLWLSGSAESEDKRQSRALAALDAVGLSDRADDPVAPLSGGERQRVAIARAIVNEPRLLLADEPTGNLDERATRGVLDLFWDINAKGMAVLMATHDLELVRRYPHARVFELDQGRLVYDSAEG